MFKLKTMDDAYFMAAAINARQLIKASKPYEFDMSTWAGHACNSSECGTSHCIGGWVDLAAGGNGNHPPFGHFPNLSEDVTAAAEKLFQPETGKAWTSKKKHGLQALDNFIAQKSNPWKGVDFNV